MITLDIIQRKLKEAYSKKRNCEANIFILIVLNIVMASLIILTLFNFAIYLKEYTAFIAIASLASFTLWGLLFFIYLRSKQLKNYSQISEQIEQLTREFQDSLNAVANLIDQNKPRLSSIELALVKNSSAKVKSHFDTNFLIPKKYVNRLTILLVTLLISIVIISQNQILLKKSFWGFKDWTSNLNTYFKVEPENFRTRRGSTIKITTQLTREAIMGAPVHVNILKSNLPPEKIMMRHIGENFYEVNIYDVQVHFDYYVSNSNVDSPVYSITIFDIPEFVEKELTIEPPFYTGLPLQKLSEFEYITVPENSRIQIKLTTNKRVNAFFKNENNSKPFQLDSHLKYSYLFRVKEYTEYSLVLIDDDKFNYETNPEWTIETIPDLPPSAEIKEPANDRKVLGIEEIEFKYTLSDDYGITKAQIVFQTPQEGLVSIPLEIQKSEKGKGVILDGSISISLLNLSLQNGDIISYYIKLWDNKEPEVQVNVSAVKFISIIPGKVEKDENDPQKGKGQEFRIDDLIAESKRIYRSSLPLQFEKNKNTVLEQAVINANALGDLKTATALRHAKLSELVMGQIPPDINNLFLSVGNYLDDAEKSMRTNNIGTSLQSQILALQTLYNLAKILEQDSPPPEEPSEENTSSEKEKKESEKDKKDKKDKTAELKKKIQDWLNNLEDLKERNSGINHQLGKTGDNLSEDEKKYFGEKKNQIKSQIQNIAEEMQSHHEVFSVADHLSNARREVTNEEYNLTKGQKQTALKHGVKTDFFLNQALKQLKDIKKEIDQSAIQQAQKAASDLINKQNELKSKSQKENDSKEQAKLSKEQEDLKEDLKNLQEQIKQAIQQTENNSPQASNELEKSLANLKNEHLDQKMGKASKSIFYGLKEKVLQEQNGILKSLQEAKDQIQKAAESMSDADKQQLMKALAQLSEIHNSSKENSEKQKAEEIKSALEEVGGPNTPQFLKDTIKIAEQIKDSPEGKNSGITADQLLLEAMSLIEKKLKSMEKNDQVRKKMSQQLPPDLYKKMVEEYFQNLNKKNQ